MGTDRVASNQVVVMSWEPEDDVIVEFEGADHQGHVLKVEHGGWVRCLIETDWAYDYGSITPRMAPQQTVLVRSSSVKTAH